MAHVPTLESLLAPHSWKTAPLRPPPELEEKGCGKEATQALAAGLGLLGQGILGSWVGVWSRRRLELQVGTTLWALKFFIPWRKGPSEEGGPGPGRPLPRSGSIGAGKWQIQETVPGTLARSALN